MTTLTLFFTAAIIGAAAAVKPNVVYVLADDLGIVDVKAFDPSTNIKTAEVDKIVSEGMKFTHAYSASAVCTPTRYGILSGRYCWRTKLQKLVVRGNEANLIAEGRPTVASFLKSTGYETAIIGKWHLNFQAVDHDGKPYTTKFDTMKPGTSIIDGPVTRGFDYFHGFHHAGSMSVIVENNTIVEVDKDLMHMLPRIASKSVAYINQVDATKPFFLFVSLSSPHNPVVPTPEWKGKSGQGNYGDFVMMTDSVVGEISTALETNGLKDNTIFVFTSDNGQSKEGKISDMLRGRKSDVWDGGVRVPFVIRWPGHIQAASTSTQVVSLNDLFATVADIVDKPLPTNGAEDSVSMLPTLKGEPFEKKREGIVHHSYYGYFGYRMGKWKIVLARGSGGWALTETKAKKKYLRNAQLYDMQKDPKETNNLFEKGEYTQIAKTLIQQLQDIVAAGRSTSGPKANNDIDDDKIILFKSGYPEYPSPVSSSPTQSPVPPTPTPTFSPQTTPSPTESFPTPSPTSSAPTKEAKLSCCFVSPGKTKFVKATPPFCRAVDESQEGNFRCCSDNTKANKPYNSNGWKYSKTCEIWAASKEIKDGPTGCPGKKTFADAQAYCVDGGARLCTLDEMINECTSGTGCSLSREHMWTSTCKGAIATPTPLPTSTPTPAPTSPLPTTTPAPTPSPTPSPTKFSTPNPTPNPIPSPTTSIPSPTSTPSPITSSPTPSPTPTPTTSAPTPSPITSAPTSNPTTTSPTPSPTPDGAAAQCRITLAGGKKYRKKVGEECVDVSIPTNFRCCSDSLSNPYPAGKWQMNKGCSVFAASEKMAAGNEHKKCRGKATWTDANAYCLSINARLCTREETLADCNADTGCSLNRRPVWTSSPKLD